uniref:Uncharacterized protein n=1 Tax=Vitis vinifera TaxID=29760 RepID=A5BB54_VITVI|nr:hypothetical protein VITISV_015164 [Vitis vinifera]
MVYGDGLWRKTQKTEEGGDFPEAGGRPQRSPRSRERPDLGRDNWSERGRNTPRSRIGRSRYSFPPLCSLNPSFPMHLVTFTHPPPYFSHDSGGVAAGGGGPSRACRGSSSRLHARPQLQASTPTLECDGERGTGGEGRGGGVDSGQPGQILRPSGAASLTSISPVAVSVGEEEDDLKACWWTWSFGFGLGLC